MLKIALFCSASAIALCVGVPASASKARVPTTHIFWTAHRITSVVPGSVTLYDQNNSTNGVPIVSQNFTSGSLTAYNSYGADDFVIPSGHKWKIREVEITGAYYIGPATSENVLFYKDNEGLPGGLIAECDNLKGADNHGSFAIKIPKACKVSLRGGKTYWLSVAANVDYSCCGEWGWETRNAQNGNPAAWENPNDGYGTGCTNWDVMTSCVGDTGEGPDFMFTLKGKDVVL